MSKASAQAQEYSKNIKEGTGSAQIYADKQKVLNQSIQNTGTASKVAAIGVKALSIAGNMLAGMAISFAISKVIDGIEYLVTASERAIEKTKELQEEISQISSDYESERSTLVGLKDEYDSLTSKIGENGAKASLSADEYERYRDITSEILGITPKLITGWDEEGRAISNKNNLLQMSIDLLDEEYRKSLRNSTTKSKNEDIAAGIIEQKKDFDNSGDTKTVSGTKYDLVWKDLKNYVDKAVTDKKINYTYKSTGIIGKDDADAAYAINEFVYGDSLYEASELNTAYGWLGSLQERITSSKENFEKFANSLSNEDNPIYQWFTDEQIDELIRDADEYFQELARIEGEDQQYFQQYKDQLNLNAQAVGDAYSGLDEQTKAGITQMIDSFDYSDMTKEKFSDTATDLKDFVKNLSTDDTLLSYFNNLFKPMGEDESIKDYETRVKTGIDEITSYCESNYPAIKLSFGDVEGDVENLKEKYNTAISRFVGESNNVDLRKFFKDNSINDESEIDYWNKVTNGAKTAEEAVKMYNDAKKTDNKTDNSSITSFSQAWEALANTDVDSLKNAQKDLLSLAEAGQLTVGALKEIGAEDYFKGLGISAERAVNKINDLVTASDQLSSMQSGITSISDVLYEKEQNLGEKETANVGTAPDTLAGFDATIKGLDTWETFERTLSNGKSSLEDCKKAANALATEWVNSNNFLAQLDETNKDYYISALKNMGVANAEAVVKKALTSIIIDEKEALEEATEISKSNNAAKEIGIEKTRDLDNATISEIGSLISYGDKLGIATGELQKLMNQKIMSATYNALSENDFTSIVKYCKYLGIAIAELEALQAAKANKKAVVNDVHANDNNSTSLHYEQSAKQSLETAKGNVVKAAQEELDDLFANVDVSVGKTPSQLEQDKKNTEKETKESKAAKFKEEIDWTAQAVTVLQQKIDDLNTKLQNTEGYDAQHKILQQLISDQEELSKAYKKQADTYKNEYLASIQGLSKSDINKIENGAYTIETFQGKAKSGKKSAAEKQYEKLQNAVEAYNNYQDALSNVKSTKQEAKSTRIQDKENYSSKLSTQADTKSGKLENTTSYKKKKQLINQIADLNVKDLNSQIKIAKLQGDIASQKNLQQQITSIQLQKEQDLLQLAIDRYEQMANTYSAQYDLALTAEEQNQIIDKQIANTKDSYKAKIAMLDKDTQSKEIAELKAQEEKEILDYQHQKVDNLIEENTAEKELTDTLKESSGYYKDKNEYIDKLIELTKEECGLEISKLDPEKQSVEILALQAEQAKTVADYTKEKLENERDYLAVLNEGLNAQLDTAGSLDNKLKLNQGITNNEIKDLLLQYEEAQTQGEKDAIMAQVKQRAAENEVSEADIITQWFENQRMSVDHTKSLMDQLVSLNETNGYAGSSIIVQEQIALEQERLGSLKKENEKLKESLDNVEPYSDAWYEIQEKIYQSTENLYEANLTLAECEKTLREINDLKFDNIINSMSALIDESNFLIDLLDDKEMFNTAALEDAISAYTLAGKERISKGISEISQAEKDALKEIESAGEMTDEGKAVMGQHMYNYEVYMQQAQKYADEVARINQELAKDSNKANTELIAQKQEYEEAQRQAILNANKEKESVVSYLQDALDKELDASNSLIDAKIALLDAEKALHDYRESIADTSASIALLEKKIAALEGDTSEEAMAKIQELKAELKEKMDELADNEYDRMVEVQRQALEDEKTANEAATSDMKQDTEKLWGDAANTVALDSSKILSTITSTAQDVSYQLSTYVTDAWKEAASKTAAAGTAADNYGTSITNMENSIRTQMENIVTYWENVTSAANVAAQAQISAANAGVRSDTSTGTYYNEGATTYKAETGSGTSAQTSTQASPTGEDSRAEYSRRAATESIIRNANGTGAGTSALNRYLGTNLSYAQMAELGSIYGLSPNADDYNSGKSSDAKKNKDALLEQLKNAGFSKGGIIEKDLSSVVKANGDNTIVSARVGEGILTEKSVEDLKDTMADAKDAQNHMIRLEDAPWFKEMQEKIFSGDIPPLLTPSYIGQTETAFRGDNIYYGGNNVTVEQNIHVDGSLDETVLPQMKKMMTEVADDRIEAFRVKQNRNLRSLGRH